MFSGDCSALMGSIRVSWHIKESNINGWCKTKHSWESMGTMGINGDVIAIQSDMLTDQQHRILLH